MGLDQGPAGGGRVVGPARLLEERAEGEGRDRVDRDVLLLLDLRQDRLHLFEAKERGAVLPVREDESVLEDESLGAVGVGVDGAALGEEGLGEARHVKEDAGEACALVLDFPGLDPPATEARGGAFPERQARLLL